MRLDQSHTRGPLEAPHKVLYHVEVAIDASPQTQALIPTLNRYLAPERVITRFVYAVPHFVNKPFAEETAAQQDILQRINTLLDGYCNQMAAQNLSITDRVFIEEGKTPEAALLSHLEETPVDLLVMGTENPHPPHHGWRIDSTSYYVATHAPSSVLVIKQPLTDTRPLKVLYATDGSEHAQKALQSLMSFLPTQGTSLSIVSVATVNAYVLPVVEPFVDYTPLERAMTGEAQKLLTDTRETLEKAGYTVTDTVFALGDPVDQIMETAETSQADLIILGSHGRGNRLSQLLLGSVSARVLEYASCSVGILK